MNLPIFLLNSILEFWIATIPLITVFYLKRFCKIGCEKILAVLILQLLLSVYFWIKIGNINIVLYQIFPYLSSFIWVLGDLYIKKKQSK